MIDSPTILPPYAIIFDFGNVLIEWDPRYLYRKFFPGNEAGMEKFLGEISFTEWNIRQDAGRSFAVGVEYLCTQFPQYRDLIHAYNDQWEQSICGAIWPTVSILEKLKKAAYPLYGLSNFSSEKFPLVQQRYHFFEWFDHILLSGDVGIVKPDKRIFHLMSERIQRPAHHCLLVDDSLPNIQAAQQIGFQAIHFRNAEQLKRDLLSYGINPN